MCLSPNFRLLSLYWNLEEEMLSPAGEAAGRRWVGFVCHQQTTHLAKYVASWTKVYVFIWFSHSKKKYSGRGRILAIYCEAPLDQISANDSHLFPPFRNDLLYKLMSAYLNALSDSVLGAMAISDRDWGWTHQSCGSQCCHYVHW